MKLLYFIFLEVCDFDDLFCFWKVGNWMKRKGNVFSEGIGLCSKDIDSKCIGYG